MKKHNLKILPQYFEAVINGCKNFEIRKNDRFFKLNDILFLKEYNPIEKKYTGCTAKCKVIYIESRRFSRRYTRRLLRYGNKISGIC